MKHVHPFILPLPDLRTGEIVPMNASDLEVDLLIIDLKIEKMADIAELHVLKRLTADRFRALTPLATGNRFISEVAKIESIKSQYLRMRLKIKKCIRDFSVTDRSGGVAV